MERFVKITFALLIITVWGVSCIGNGSGKNFKEEKDNKTFATKEELWDFIKNYRYENLKQIWGEGEVGEPWDASGIGELRMRISVKWKDVKCMGKSVKIDFKNDFLEIKDAFDKSPGDVQSYELYDDNDASKTTIPSANYSSPDTIYNYPPVDTVKVGGHAESSNMNFDYSGEYLVPPPSGMGTGTCYIKLEVRADLLKAVHTCGGHNQNGHTEKTQVLFGTDFKQNYKYRVTDYAGGSELDVFGCEYFEFKNGKLYLYDSNFNIIHDWFCTQGKKDSQVDENGNCDCIFLKQ